ncbi:MAG: peptide chain release factor N(5)-glutamine methyltransferase [Christensenellales bacterium]|jgi:release factor glutamine methyltransferase
MTIRAALQQGEAALFAAGVPSAEHDAGELLAHVLGEQRLHLLLRCQEKLPLASHDNYQRLIARRAAREPLQYIVGSQEFMGLTLAVRPGVLIPREDTVVVVQQALHRLPHGETVLDVGTGSGAIALAIKHLRPDAQVTAVDISPHAVALASDNARACGLDVEILQGDGFVPVLGRRFDVIVSNPPYIPSRELPHLQQEVQGEPALALDGGADGLDFYRRLFGQAPQHLKPAGHLVVELGDHQAQDVKTLARRDFCGALVYDDLAGLPRALAAQLR